MDKYEIRILPPEKRIRVTSIWTSVVYHVRRRGEPFFIQHREHFATRQEAIDANERWLDRAMGRWNVSMAPRSLVPTDEWIASLTPDYGGMFESDIHIESAEYPPSGLNVYWLVGHGMPTNFCTKDLRRAREKRDHHLAKWLAGSRPCVFCREPESRNWTGFRHRVPGCPNSVSLSLRGLTPAAKKYIWNHEFAQGFRQNFGMVTYRDLWLMNMSAKARDPYGDHSGLSIPPEEDVFIPVY